MKMENRRPKLKNIFAQKSLDFVCFLHFCPNNYYWKKWVSAKLKISIILFASNLTENCIESNLIVMLSCLCILIFSLQ